VCLYVYVYIPHSTVIPRNVASVKITCVCVYVYVYISDSTVIPRNVMCVNVVCVCVFVCAYIPDSTVIPRNVVVILPLHLNSLTIAIAVAGDRATQMLAIT